MDRVKIVGFSRFVRQDKLTCNRNGCCGHVSEACLSIRSVGAGMLIAPHGRTSEHRGASGILMPVDHTFLAVLFAKKSAPQADCQAWHSLALQHQGTGRPLDPPFQSPRFCFRFAGISTHFGSVCYEIRRGLETTLKTPVWKRQKSVIDDCARGCAFFRRFFRCLVR